MRTANALSPEIAACAVLAGCAGFGGLIAATSEDGVVVGSLIGGIFGLVAGNAVASLLIRGRVFDVQRADSSEGAVHKGRRPFIQLSFVQWDRLPPEVRRQQKRLRRTAGILGVLFTGPILLGGLLGAAPLDRMSTFSTVNLALACAGSALLILRPTGLR